MWNIFFHIFGECKILCAEILQFSKKGQQKKIFSKISKEPLFLTGWSQEYDFYLVLRA